MCVLCILAATQLSSQLHPHTPSCCCCPKDRQKIFYNSAFLCVRDFDHDHCGRCCCYWHWWNHLHCWLSFVVDDYGCTWNFLCMCLCVWVQFVCMQAFYILFIFFHLSVLYLSHVYDGCIYLFTYFFIQNYLGRNVYTCPVRVYYPEWYIVLFTCSLYPFSSNPSCPFLCSLVRWCLLMFLSYSPWKLGLCWLELI